MIFRKEALLELMKEQNMLSLNRQPLWDLGGDASFGAGGLIVNGTTTSNGVAATILAPILPGSIWRITTSSVFTTGSATITFGGNLITLVGGADEVWTITVDKATTDTIDPKIIVNQVVDTGTVDVSISQFKIKLMDDFFKEQDIRGYFGRNDIVEDINSRILGN